MSTDLRALITQMAAELDHCQQLLRDDRRQRHPLADRARTLLAEADGPAVPDGREPAAVAVEARPLSPAAQAVLDAMHEVNLDFGGENAELAAAALRAAADQCKIEWNYHPDYPETESVIVVSDLLDIAAELEALP